ncbi:MAG: protoglobin domain-containing protein [Dehalococcoidia bacterium]
MAAGTSTMRESLIEELKRYVGFTPDDADTLRALGPVVDTHLGALTDRFYSQIPAHPEAAEVFTGGEVQIARLRQSLQHWARGLFAGVYDEAYADQRLKIGLRHVALGLPQRYVLGAIHVVDTFLRHVLTEALSEHGRRAEALGSLSRILSIDTCLICESYFEGSLAALRAANTQLRDANLRLEQANREKTEFLAIVSHELRTPLTSLLGFAKLQADGHVAAAADRENVNREIHRAGDLVMDLLDDFVDISRMDAGLLTLTSAAVDVASVITEVSGLTEPAARARGLSLCSAIHGIPPVSADARRLRQVFLNVVGNAIKFTDAGEIRLEATVDGSSRQALITVRDTGVGVPRRRQPFVFERFHHFDPKANEPRAGVGLGLSIARDLVRRMGGDIALASDGEGRGTTVTVSLPLHGSATPPGALRATDAREVP